MMKISPIIENHLKNARNKRDEERGHKKEYFYASDSLVENPEECKCIRKLCYEFSDINPEPLDDKTLKVFAIGEILHEWIQDILIKEKKAKIIEEFTITYDKKGNHLKTQEESNRLIIKDPVEIHGRIDAMLVDDTIIEIKTISKGAFFYLGNAPRLGHYLQLQLYMYNKKIKNGTIFYINKDTGEFKEFELKYNHGFVMGSLKRFVKAKEVIDKFKETGKLPVQPFIKTSWQCAFCAYAKECWK